MTIACPVWIEDADFFGTGIATVDHGSRGVASGRLILIKGADVPIAVSQLVRIPQPNQPNQPFRPAFEGWQCRVDSDDRATSSWSTAGAHRLQLSGSTEFSLPKFHDEVQSDSRRCFMHFSYESGNVVNLQFFIDHLNLIAHCCRGTV